MLTPSPGRAWFTSTLGDLVAADHDAIVGTLTRAAAQRRLEPNPESDAAWTTTVQVLLSAAAALSCDIPASATWGVRLEFELPRRRRRLDVVLLAEDVLFVIEIKAGAVIFDRASRWQTEQYALDLRDFHEGSHGRPIAPILVATSAPGSEDPPSRGAEDFVRDLEAVTGTDLAAAILRAYEDLHDPSRAPISHDYWDASQYRPTPSIVEAARSLYDGHDVRAISTAGAQNLDATVEAVVDLVSRCQRESRKGVAFVTGAPGSGKTLAGLQVVHDSRLAGAGSLGVFLSGNMPLVEVISSALSGSGKVLANRRAAARDVGTFIQHAYLFRNEYAEVESRVPPEHIVLFDEAQRAWTERQVTKWSRGLSTRSEPRILLDVMNRVPGWAVVIAMVGGGQEINTGEAGLSEWGRALSEFHSDWLVAASPLVMPGSAEPPGGLLFDDPSTRPTVELDSRLHLTMSVRSPRAERLSAWVDALLEGRDPLAYLPTAREFPIAVTRELALAKRWLRDRTDVDQRCGLVMSAEAQRLRAWGLDSGSLKQDRGWANWFLRELGDVRSSNQLEVAATPFDCQGLELDWVGVCWGNDFWPGSAGWQARRFRGTRWMRTNEERFRYILNGYRVLLTRARRGQIIWVPRPDGTDGTLEIEYFEAVAKVLRQAGAQYID